VSENTTFGIFAIMFGVVVLLGAPLMLEANTRSVRKSKIFRGHGVDGHWATYNRFIIYLVGALAIVAGVAALFGLLPG
jgi:uncharacterized membrane protein HdeD (DUF308 family)